MHRWPRQHWTRDWQGRVGTADPTEWRLSDPLSRVPAREADSDPTVIEPGAVPAAPPSAVKNSLSPERRCQRPLPARCRGDR